MTTGWHLELLHLVSGRRLWPQPSGVLPSKQTSEKPSQNLWIGITWLTKHLGVENKHLPRQPGFQPRLSFSLLLIIPST